MSQSEEHVALTCPACSPKLETSHEILTTHGEQATVRCTECDHVHKERVPEQSTVERDVIISQEGESFKTTVEAPPEEIVARGEEFVVETEDAIMEVRITDLQTGAEQRTEQSPIRNVDTLWTRAVGNISINVTIHPNNGSKDKSRSLKIYVPGDYEFTVGEQEEFDDETFEITGIHIRDDATGYEMSKLDHDGDSALAKDINRLYGKDMTSSAWSAW